MIGQFQFAELQAISYAITREKAPIYTMGSADPRAYSRNKRGIAGNLIWINFDRHALLNLFHFATAAMRPTWTGTVPSSRPRRPRRTRRSPRRSFAHRPVVGDTRSRRPAGQQQPSRARASRTDARRAMIHDRPATSQPVRVLLCR